MEWLLVAVTLGTPVMLVVLVVLWVRDARR